MRNMTSGAVDRSIAVRITRIALLVISLVLVSLALVNGQSRADPSDPPVPPLPEVNAQPNSWTPKFPYPYDSTRKSVTDADITAMGEMCQWYKVNYKELSRRIDNFDYNLLQANNDWTVGLIQAQADAVAANIDQATDFLAPRAQSLTQTTDYAGDNYFPIYEGESFYRLWQHLSNVGVGIRARNTAWVNGPSVQRFKHWGSRIQRSHVCDS